MHVKLKSLLGIVIFAPSLIVLSDGSAGATQLPNNLSSAQATVQTQIAKRITRLGDLTNRVNVSTTISSSDRSALLGIYGNSTGGDIQALNSLSIKVGSETTVAGVQADRETLYDTYRIYAIVAPQSDLVLAADNETSVINVMTSLEPGLSAIVKAGGSTSATLADYNQFVSDVGAAQTAVGSISSQVLALTPTLFNQDKSGTAALIQSDWKSIKSAQASLKEARGEINAIILAAG